MTVHRYYVPASPAALATSSHQASSPIAASVDPPHVPTAVPDPAPWTLPPPPGQTWPVPPRPPVGSGDRPMRWWQRLPKPSLIAAVLALAAFVVRVSIWKKSSENGVVTSCTYVDVGAIALGGATVLLSVWGALAAVVQRRPGRYAVGIVFGLAIVTAGLGIFHVFRGLDLVLPQCPEIGSFDTSAATGS